jgi:hypothetical protein
LGRLLEDFWKTLGRLYEDFAKTLGRLLEDFGKTPGRLYEDFWKTMGVERSISGGTIFIYSCYALLIYFGIDCC